MTKLNTYISFKVHFYKVKQVLRIYETIMEPKWQENRGFKNITGKFFIFFRMEKLSSSCSLYLNEAIAARIIEYEINFE